MDTGLRAPLSPSTATMDAASDVVSATAHDDGTLTVVAYSRPAGACCRSDAAAERVRVVQTVACSSLADARARAAELLAAARGGRADLESAAADAPPHAPAAARQRLLVVANPSSGPGGSVERFRAHCEPLLADAGFDCDVFVTRGARDSTAHLAGLPAAQLAAYAGLVVVGGDGSVHECLQGLLGRRDAGALLAPGGGMPRVGIIPTGSGNGMAYSFCKAAGLPFTLSDCALLIAQRRCVRVDVASVFTAGGGDAGDAAPPASCDLPPSLPAGGAWGRRHFSFLSLEWGLVADLDIESEALRCLGAARFDLYGAWRGLFLRRYTGSLSWLPAAAAAAAAASSEAAADAGSAAGAGATTLAAHAATGAGKAAPPSSRSPFQLRSLRPFDAPLDATDGWVTSSGVFTLLWITSSSHQSVGVSCSPTARADDGRFTITLVRDVSPPTMIAILLGLDARGSLTAHPAVEVHQAVAYRLAPDTQQPLVRVHGRGNIVVDGETAPYAPTQAEMHPRLLPMWGAT